VNADLEIKRRQLFALFGPNGARKPTLINIIFGVLNPSNEFALINGLDVVRDFRSTRELSGLAPKEVAFDPRHTV
jgi:ABC-type multidrug transport system ATPase subunit